MIKQRTVFVLGAGASAPYGLPTGTKLADNICRALVEPPSPEMRLRLGRAGFNEEDAVAFAKALKAQRSYSVDRFLEMRSEFLEVGKAAIADVLLEAERSKELTSATVEEDWYRLLFNQIVRRDRSFFESQAQQLSIVTFNFDRSFERALFDAVCSGYAASGDDAAQLVGQLKVHHIHGWLGAPGWLSSNSDSVDYDAAANPDQRIAAIRVAANSMKIVHEPGSEEVIERARDLLRQASRIYFLGFGYHEENMKKLDPGSFRSSIVRGTFFDMGQAQKNFALHQFPHGIHEYRGNVCEFLRDIDAIFD